MKILLIHNKYQQSGGEDAVFEAEQKLLIEGGNEVEVIYFDNSEINNFNKLALPFKIIYNSRSKKIVQEVVDKFNPEVIHIHNFFYTASPAIIYATKKAIPVVLTLHNFRLICSGSLLMRDSRPCEICINKKFPIHGIAHNCHRGSKVQTAQLTLTTGIHKVLNTWKKISVFISLTEFARDKFIHSSLGVKPINIVVKPNSVDQQDFSPYAARGNNFLFIGRLSHEKGVDVLLKAFANTALPLEIIGDGPMREQVERAAELNSNIVFSGFRNKDYISTSLKKSKALIVPSICYENLPTAVLEAFSTGTPVIISDLDNLNKIVTNRHNGIHFKTNDASALHAAALDLHENHSNYKDLYLNARTTYEELYTHEKNYENLMTIYKFALNEFKLKNP